MTNGSDAALLLKIDLAVCVSVEHRNLSGPMSLRQGRGSSHTAGPRG